MSSLRRALLLSLALAVLAPAQAALAKPKPVAVPGGLKAFLLRADEPAADSFARTPSFAWSPVPGTKRYDVELATSSRFTASSIVWKGSVSRTPAMSVPVALPWMTGSPHALFAHVRSTTRAGTSSWSAPYGFNLQAPAAPKQLGSPTPGLVRWETVPGATSYQVWFLDFGKVIGTITNAADEREYFTFHQGAPWTSAVHWRVRAVRAMYGGVAKGLPAVAYGPWSEPYTSVNPPFQVGRPLSLGTTVSEELAAASETQPHAHTPAFVFSGTDSYLGYASELSRVYVFTDRDCLNLVYRGAVVGSPAYAPRTTGPLALPASVPDIDSARTRFLPDGAEGTGLMADGSAVTTSEARSDASAPDDAAPASAGADGFALPAPEGALVDLWDTGGPNGRYYWTVVPVTPYVNLDEFTYRDLELAQDACKSGKVKSFGKVSEPVVTADRSTRSYTAQSPFASGLSTNGRLVSAATSKPSFYGMPLVAWRPAFGAAAYEVQWSKSASPWRTAGSAFTFGTSSLLGSDAKPLTPGTWFYRVRGLTPYLPGAAKQLTWSDPARLLAAKPTFAVVRK
ncbi:MAG: hypothetical protein ABR521_11695 [Gaiellaceae bacterium]